MSKPRVTKPQKQWSCYVQLIIFRITKYGLSSPIGSEIWSTFCKGHFFYTILLWWFSSPHPFGQCFLLKKQFFTKCNTIQVKHMKKIEGKSRKPKILIFDYSFRMAKWLLRPVFKIIMLYKTIYLNFHSCKWRNKINIPI